LVKFFHKLIIFKFLLEFLNPTFIFINVTKLNALDRILFYAKLNPCCMREEGAVLVCLPAHCSQPLYHSAEALPSGFSTELPHYVTAYEVSVFWVKLYR
jgi:hypothetical protein